jgi:hypothetical protein
MRRLCASEEAWEVSVGGPLERLDTVTVWGVCRLELCIDSENIVSMEVDSAELFMHM